jgi:hypothetical protein
VCQDSPRPCQRSINGRSQQWELPNLGSVARWEKTGRAPKWADKLIRLVYAAHANGDAPIRRAIERARTVERLTSQRILVKESRHGWTPAIVDHEDDTAVA